MRVIFIPLATVLLPDQLFPHSFSGGGEFRVCDMLRQGQNGEVAMPSDPRLPLLPGSVFQSIQHPGLLPQPNEGGSLMFV